jgi:glycine oxidase
VRGLSTGDGRVVGVTLGGGGFLAAERVVLAAGAWSGQLAGLPHPLPIRPVLGQMVALGTSRPLPRRIVGGAGVYLLPRSRDTSHRIWVGATMEERGFSTTTTRSARQWLTEGAARLFPELARSEVLEHWCGLRPAAPDGLPVLGPDPRVEGLFYATGHFRNGILLAPVTAALLGAALEGAIPEPLRSFLPNRFSSGGQAPRGSPPTLRHAPV